MIVKNEAKVIQRGLSSAKPLIDYWVIVDTGSKDGTQKIIKEYLKDIPGELHERPWKNFEHNRNEALQLAKDKGDYVLFLDADDEFHFEEDFQLPYLDKDCYYITASYSGCRYERNLLVNNQLPWKWVGVLHEVILCPDAQTFGALEKIVNFVRPEGARSQNPNKFLEDAQVLEKALEKEPHNARYMFYLAQSYRDAKKPEKAIEAYKKRVEMGGWEEEVFFSKYQIAFLEDQLESPHWVEKFSAAYQYRPHRAEPLYHLARKFRLEGNFFLGYLVASHGVTLPYPKDILLVEKWIYDYGLLLEKSVSAYWLGKYEESAQLCLTILEQKDLPSHIKETVQNNLEWALAKLFPNSEKSLEKILKLTKTLY